MSLRHVLLLLLLPCSWALISYHHWDTGIGEALALLAQTPNATIQIELWPSLAEWQVEYMIWVYQECWPGILFLPSCTVHLVWPPSLEQYRLLLGSVVCTMKQTLTLSGTPSHRPLCTVCEPLFESTSPTSYDTVWPRYGSRNTWTCGPQECYESGRKGLYCGEPEFHWAEKATIKILVQ
jgi:hypothetical protein